MRSSVGWLLHKYREAGVFLEAQQLGRRNREQKDKQPVETSCKLQGWSPGLGKLGGGQRSVCKCVRLCVKVCAQKIEEEGAIEGAEKRQAKKSQDPSSGDHQPSMADSREQAAERVQSRRGAP